MHACSRSGSDITSIKQLLDQMYRLELKPDVIYQTASCQSTACETHCDSEHAAPPIQHIIQSICQAGAKQ